MKPIHTNKVETITLPFEEGETYTTKMATGEKFTVDRIEYRKTNDGDTDEPRMLFGRYEKSPYLLNCGISPERLIPRKKETGKTLIVSQCPHCKEEITLD